MPYVNQIFWLPYQVVILPNIAAGELSGILHLLCLLMMSVHCSGRTYSLRPTEVSYVLPGGRYETKDVEAISAAADEACQDEKLMELAWEVSIPPVPAIMSRAHDT